MSDYCHGVVSEPYAFVKFPKALFMDERYQGLSIEAKVLYALMLDRIGISVKNGLFDDYGRVYVFFTFKEIKEIFQCADHKANNILKELEKEAGLIEKVGQGRGKPTRILIKNFLLHIPAGKQKKHCQKSSTGVCQKSRQSTAQTAGEVLSKEQSNNTYINNTSKKTSKERSYWQIEEHDYDFEALERELLGE